MVPNSGNGSEISIAEWFEMQVRWDRLRVTSSRPYGTFHLSNLYPGLRPGLSSVRPVQIRFEKRLGSATNLYGTVALSFVIPSVPGFPASPLSPATTYVVLPKENHMQLTEAATLDRKSGEADLSRRAVEGSAVPRTFRGNAGFSRSALSI